MSQNDPCDRLESIVLKISKMLKEDPRTRESFKLYRLQAEEQYQKQRLELERFEAASPLEQQRMIDKCLKNIESEENGYCS